MNDSEKLSHLIAMLRADCIGGKLLSRAHRLELHTLGIALASVVVVDTMALVTHVLADSQEGEIHARHQIDEAGRVVRALMSAPALRPHHE